MQTQIYRREGRAQAISAPCRSAVDSRGRYCSAVVSRWSTGAFHAATAALLPAAASRLHATSSAMLVALRSAEHLNRAAAPLAGRRVAPHAPRLGFAAASASSTPRAPPPRRARRRQPRHLTRAAPLAGRRFAPPHRNAAAARLPSSGSYPRGPAKWLMSKLKTMVRC